MSLNQGIYELILFQVVTFESYSELVIVVVSGDAYQAFCIQSNVAVWRSFVSGTFSPSCTPCSLTVMIIEGELCAYHQPSLCR